MFIIQPSASRTTNPRAPAPSSKLLGSYHSSALRTDNSTFWAKLRVSVTGNKSGATQPVAGADVLVRSQTGEFEETAKTDPQGNADISDVPFGETLIQVTAPGWNNHGQTHELKKKEETIEVQLTSTSQETPTPTPTPTATPTPTPFEQPAFKRWR
jgi:hypothetical protein